MPTLMIFLAPLECLVILGTMKKYYIITGIHHKGDGLHELILGDPDVMDVKAELTCLKDDWCWTKLRMHRLPDGFEDTIQAMIADVRWAARQDGVDFD